MNQEATLVHIHAELQRIALALETLAKVAKDQHPEIFSAKPTHPPK